MSTTYAEVKCCQCGYEKAYFASDTRRKYLCVTCSRCGWEYVEFAEIDEDLTRAMGKEWDYFKVDADGKVIFQTKELQGYGAYRIVIGMTHEHGSFHQPMTQDDIDKFISDMATQGEINNAKSYVSIWEDELKDARIVYGETSWLYAGIRDN